MKGNGDTVLDTEILENIQAFSGDAEQSAGERMLREGMSIQKVQTSYTTAMAVQKPRSIVKVAHNVLEEAKLAGASFYYRWEVFDKEKGRKVPVEGESIDLAMCLARNYGNCVTDVEVEENATHFLFKGVFIDLETGFTCPRLYRQRKKQKISGKMDTDRQEDMVFQIGQSKAVRNAIVKAGPAWLFKEAIETAKQAELNKIKPENINLARAKVIDFFSKHGVNCERIEAERGRKVDEWTPQDIVDLRGMATALQEGSISPDKLFPQVDKEEDVSKEVVQVEAEEKKAPEPTKPEMVAEIQAKIGEMFSYDEVRMNGYLGSITPVGTQKYTVAKLMDMTEAQARSALGMVLVAHNEWLKKQK